MPDESLRLPSTLFRAVLNLRAKPAARLPLPPGFAKPELDAEWDEDTEVTALFVAFEDGQLHLECSDSGVEYHFHDRTGEAAQTSPWPANATDTLLEWATALAADVHLSMPELEEEVEEAAAWHEEGFTIYVCETEPAQLDLLEVELEGEILTLPWLGSGRVSHEHIDGDNHPIALLWNPEEDEPDKAIARAWLDFDTDEPKTEALPGIDWTAVGLTESEVLSWLEGIYLNHHLIADPAAEILRAALERMGGVDAKE